MAINQEKSHVAKKYFPREVIIWILHRCNRTTEFKVGMYQIVNRITWSFKGKVIATGIFPTDMFCASFKIIGFGYYLDTEIKGYSTREYQHLGRVD